jgi:hypothetical protein
MTGDWLLGIAVALVLPELSSLQLAGPTVKATQIREPQGRGLSGSTFNREGRSTLPHLAAGFWPLRSPLSAGWLRWGFGR